MNNKTFHIGITMAGAISAGAYTGGVIDYMLETLESWQVAKDINKKIIEEYPKDYLGHGYDLSIPMHDVVIDVMSGASAGGITAIVATMGLMEGIQPFNVTSSTDKNTNEWRNKLYECWVDMVDDDTTTLQKLLSTDDLKEYDDVRSVLNSEVIEAIGNKAKNLKVVKNHLPAYISKELDVILSVSNLRGLRFVIDFDSNGQDNGTSITLHSGFFHYRIVPKEKVVEMKLKSKKELYDVPDFENEKDLANLVRAAKSTGAFPIGLSAVQNSVPTVKVKKYTDELFAKSSGVQLATPLEGDSYQFVSVDGGMLNNEPFGYAYSSLKKKVDDIEDSDEYAIIMIDPFPTFDVEDKYDKRLDVINIGKNILKALRNQVMFNQEDLLDAVSESNQKRFLIAPRKKVNGVLQDFPIASGSIGGFGGFISKAFRKHDFELGRKNCKDFLRYHFSLQEKKAEKVIGLWSNEAKERFKYYLPVKRKDGKVFLPIIPDLRVKSAWNQKYPKDPEVGFKKINIQYLSQYRRILKKRLKMIVWKLLPNVRGEKFGARLTNSLFIVYLLPLYSFGIIRLKNRIFDKIVKELKEYGLLEK